MDQVVAGILLGAGGITAIYLAVALLIVHYGARRILGMF